MEVFQKFLYLLLLEKWHISKDFNSHSHW